MKKQKTMGNKGFSLVELIVVIAIMAVLVGVLAPQFVKYVEKSKASTDVQNAQEILSTLQVAITDEDYNIEGATVTFGSQGIETENTDAQSALEEAGISTTTAIKSSTYADGITFTVTSNAVYGDNKELSKALGVPTATGDGTNEAETDPAE
jgi:type IV pilus assembly protein PilA